MPVSDSARFLDCDRSRLARRPPPPSGQTSSSSKTPTFAPDSRSAACPSSPAAHERRRADMGRARLGVGRRPAARVRPAARPGPVLEHNEILVCGWAVAGAGTIAAVEVDVGSRTLLASYGHASPFLEAAFGNA